MAYAYDRCRNEECNHWRRNHVKERYGSGDSYYIVCMATGECKCRKFIESVEVINVYQSTTAESDTTE